MLAPKFNLICSLLLLYVSLIAHPFYLDIDDCIDKAKRDSKVKIACSAPIDPVCGCDGVTYDNVCRSENAGVRRFTKGPCSVKTGTGVTAPDDCISQIRVACPPSVAAVFEPVCGCDGVTYRNECIALNSVTKFVKGECGKKGDDPAPGDDCKGKAVQKTCTSLFEPVCGCDGQTYSNACVAEAAGVKRFTKGECGKKGGQSNNGWGNNDNSGQSQGNGSNKAINRSLQGCAAIWDHIKNWQGKNNERGAAKISFEIIPDDPKIVKVSEFNKTSGGKFLDVKVIDQKRLLKTSEQIVKEDNLSDTEIRLEKIKISSVSIDSSGAVDQLLSDKLFVINANNNELRINSSDGKNIFKSQLTDTKGRNDMWGKCEMNGKKYLFRLIWSRGEIVQNTSFKEVK